MSGNKYKILRKINFESHTTNYFFWNMSGFQEDILPVNALVITVKGLARYNLPGPDLP